MVVVFSRIKRNEVNCEEKEKVGEMQVVSSAKRTGSIV